MKKIGIIGFGNMGSAIAAGLIKQGFTIAVTDAVTERISLAREEYNCEVFIKIVDLVKFSELILLNLW